jgi:integrase
MGLYVKNAWYQYRKQIENKLYYKALKLRKGQERLLSERLEQVENEITARHFGLDYRPTESPRLSEYIETYLKAKAYKKSLDRDEQRLLRIEEILSDPPLSIIDKKHIEKLEKSLLASKISTTTVNRYMEILRHLFNMAIEDRIIKENPTRYYKPYIEGKHDRALSRGEIAKVLHAARQIQRRARGPVQKIIYDLILFGLNTGMRLGEIINLKKSYVSEGQVTYPITETKSPRRMNTTHKLGAKMIVLNETAQALIGRQKSKDDFVFPIRRRNVHTVSRVIRLIRKQTDISDFHFHQLRHTASTIIASQSSLAAAKVQLGHRSISTTLKYTHPDLEEQRKTVANLENWIKDILPK